MNIRKTIGYSAVAAVALVGVGATVLAAEPNLVVQAVERTGVGASMFNAGHSGWHRGGRHGGHGLMRVCMAARGDRLDDMIGFVENIMEFSAEQQTAWDELAAALRRGKEGVVKTCGELREEGRPETAPARLAMVETALQTGLTAVQDVRPAFDKFYATLSDKQKSALDDLAHRGRRH